MIDELQTSSNILKAALERYRNACLALKSQYELGNTFSDFSEIVVNALQQIASYESKIDEIRKIVHTIRNRRSNIVPISALPPELLSRIFLLARRTGPCCLARGTALSECHPESLVPILHVCSYWRSVALALPALWTHVDIAPYHKLNKRLLTFGKLFAANTGKAPLEIHINMDEPTNRPPLEPDLVEICASVAARANSIQLSLFDPGDEEFWMIRTLLANSVSRGLTRLIMSFKDGDNHSIRPGFIVANDAEETFNDVDDDDVWPLDVPHHHLEQVLRYVTVLRLDTIYPYWTSLAYHGLAKLHLTEPSGTLITVSQLAGILSASPQLCFLHFGSAIMMEDEFPTPVRLDNLEVLRLDVEEPFERVSILDIISPGSIPLRMSITLGENEIMSLTESEYKEFFTRSNVTQLHFSSRQGSASLPLPELLALVPNLQALFLGGFYIGHAIKGFLNEPDPFGDEDSEEFRLAKLHLASSTVNPDAFCWIAETYRIQSITIEERTCLVESGGDPCKLRKMEYCGEQFIDIGFEFVSGVDPVEDENWD